MITFFLFQMQLQSNFKDIKYHDISEYHAVKPHFKNQHLIDNKKISFEIPLKFQKSEMSLSVT